MWELGYAMALCVPTIVVIQGQVKLPFDIHDLQAVNYDRSRMRSTLAEPLRKSVIDTLQHHGANYGGSFKSSQAVEGDSKLIAELLTQVKDLKSIVGEAVKTWGHRTAQTPAASLSHNHLPQLMSLAGHWYDLDSSSHFYGKVVHNDLIFAYCYGGNSHLTGAFYSWEKMDDHWFTRFGWLDITLRGFAFLRNDVADCLTGSWWFDDEANSPSTLPNPLSSGNPFRLVRKGISRFPNWAEQFLGLVERSGLPKAIKP
jgi:hypothetical protein